MSNAKKIMVIDDDASILDALGIMLKLDGYEVDLKSNTGINPLNGLNNPDLLLLDIWLPGIDGRDICRHLKHTSQTSKLPIILVSASKDIEPSALEAGADDFLAKPFEMSALLKKIERLC